MNYEELVTHFGAPSKAADVLEVDRRMVNDWKTRRIPSRWQMRAQARSGGVLSADEQARAEAQEFAQYVAEQEKLAHGNAAQPA